MVMRLPFIAFSFVVTSNDVPEVVWKGYVIASDRYEAYRLINEYIDPDAKMIRASFHLEYYGDAAPNSFWQEAAQKECGAYFLDKSCPEAGKGSALCEAIRNLVMASWRHESSLEHPQVVGVLAEGSAGQKELREAP